MVKRTNGGKTMADLDKYAVPWNKLRWKCPEDIFEFQCTSDIERLKDFIGQERALDSISFGLGVAKQGYNLFLTGLTGTGKANIIKRRLQRFIEEGEIKGLKYEPSDWCYVYNFSDPDRPKILELPQGRGRSFRGDMEVLVKKLREDIPKVLANEEYSRRKQEIAGDRQKRYQEEMDILDREARERSLAIQISETGAAIIPVAEGRPISRDEFMSLNEKQRENIESNRQAIVKKVDEAFSRLREVDRTLNEKLKKVELQAGEFAIAHHFEYLSKRFEDIPGITAFLKGVKEYTLSNLELFTQTDMAQEMAGVPSSMQPDLFIAYKVNLFVDNSARKGPPVIIESNPHWFHMFGKVERRAVMGAYLSDHTLIKPGAVHAANNGYIILNIRDILLNAGVWEGLKRVIKTKEAGVEDPYEQFSFFTPQGMRPEPMPVNLKIIVMGDDYLYQLLSMYDDEFWEMFKVKADFDYQIERTDENLKAFACFIRTCCDDEQLLPFDRTGTAKVLENAARAVDSQERLSTRFGPVKDLLIESDHWAKQGQSPVVTAEHVQEAVKKKTYRQDLVAERVRRLIAEGTLMVDVDGIVIGQVNGLAVYDLGTFAFGKPSRITAKTFLGKRGVINIERESQLSGRIHDKGVFILSGYLGWKYAQNMPLTLSASVCFEQSYSGVEGDSASSTELYAILSSLAEAPVRQDIAITGSVNQKGEIQPIGGVNHKIEGFYEVCKAKGLTGTQGVIIPQQNVRHLMLREDVVEAVKEGEFHIYCVRSIDEGIEILTGTPAGERQNDGTYPEGTINFRVDSRLREMARSLKDYQSGESD